MVIEVIANIAVIICRRRDSMIEGDGRNGTRGSCS